MSDAVPGVQDRSVTNTERSLAPGIYILVDETDVKQIMKYKICEVMLSAMEKLKQNKETCVCVCVTECVRRIGITFYIYVRCLGNFIR